MKYGIENIFINEPLSLFLSIFLILGISNLGIIFQSYIKKKYSFKLYYKSFFRQYLEHISSSFFLYPLTLLGLNNNFLFKFIAILLFYLGFYFFLKIYQKF